MTDIDHPDPDQKKIIRLYAAFGAGLLLSVVPFFVAAILSLAFIFGVMIAAYILRSGTSEDSLIANHMTFILRTIWIGSFFAVITLVAGCVYLFQNLDNTPLDPCINEFLRVGPETMMQDLMKLEKIFSGCYKGYVATNFFPFVVSGLIAAGPVLVYFLVRYARGLSRALDGYRVAKPKAWF